MPSDQSRSPSSALRRRRSGPRLLAGLLASVLIATAVAAPAAADDSPLTYLGDVRHTVSGVYITTGTTEAFSTPAIADVTGDGRADLVVGSLDGQLEAYTLPGRKLIWSMSVGPLQHWIVVFSSGKSAVAS